MNRDAIIHRSIRRHHNRVGPDRVAAGGGDVRMISALDLVSVSSGEDLAAGSLDRARQSGEIFQWMKLALARKKQAWAGVEEFQRRAVQSPDFS